MQALEEEPRRVFSIESLFFLQRYWQSNPTQHERLRGLVNQRRLRLTGTGITTPDTVLPDTEAILRDYADGQEWLREHGMTVEPRLAYLPDDFGHSPALPTMLVALGFDMAAVTRIDGMYFIGCDYRPKSSFPLPGSSAESADARAARRPTSCGAARTARRCCATGTPSPTSRAICWRTIGVVRWMDRLYGFPWRTEAHVARRIRRYVRDLAPLARTPYLFCPIGGDFNGPIEGLVGAARPLQPRALPANRRLGGQRRPGRLPGAGRLPPLRAAGGDAGPESLLDGLLRQPPRGQAARNRIVRKLVIAEKLTVLPARARPTGPRRTGRSSPAIARDLRKAWDLTVMSNHHDFITGTSPDRIWRDGAAALARAGRGAGGRRARRASAPSGPRRPTAPRRRAAALAPRRGQAGGRDRRLPRRAGRAAGRRHHQLPPGRLDRGVARRPGQRSGELPRQRRPVAPGPRVPRRHLRRARARQSPAGPHPRGGARRRAAGPGRLGARGPPVRALAVAAPGLAGAAHAPGGLGPAPPDHHLPLPDPLRRAGAHHGRAGRHRPAPGAQAVPPDLLAGALVRAPAQTARAASAWPRSWAGLRPSPATARAPWSGSRSATPRARWRSACCPSWRTRRRGPIRTRGSSTTRCGSPRGGDARDNGLPHHVRRALRAAMFAPGRAGSGRAGELGGGGRSGRRAGHRAQARLPRRGRGGAPGELRGAGPSR